MKVISLSKIVDINQVKIEVIHMGDAENLILDMVEKNESSDTNNTIEPKVLSTVNLTPISTVDIIDGLKKTYFSTRKIYKNSDFIVKTINGEILARIDDLIDLGDGEVIEFFPGEYNSINCYLPGIGAEDRYQVEVLTLDGEQYMLQVIGGHRYSRDNPFLSDFILDLYSTDLWRKLTLYPNFFQLDNLPDSLQLGKTQITSDDKVIIKIYWNKLIETDLKDLYKTAEEVENKSGCYTGIVDFKKLGVEI